VRGERLAFWVMLFNLAVMISTADACWLSLMLREVCTGVNFTVDGLGLTGLKFFNILFAVGNPGLLGPITFYWDADTGLIFGELFFGPRTSFFL
jgi:hypothetical protein